MVNLSDAIQVVVDVDLIEVDLPIDARSAVPEVIAIRFNPRRGTILIASQLSQVAVPARSGDRIPIVVFIRHHLYHVVVWISTPCWIAVRGSRIVGSHPSPL